MSTTRYPTVRLSHAWSADDVELRREPGHVDQAPHGPARLGPEQQREAQLTGFSIARRNEQDAHDRRVDERRVPEVDGDRDALVDQAGEAPRELVGAVGLVLAREGDDGLVLLHGDGDGVGG